MTLSVEIAHRFEGLALDVAFETKGGVTALIGPSGAGKTTVANAVAGLLRPTRARIRVAETVLADTEAGLWQSPAQRRVGYVFQEARLFPHLSVRDNLLYGARRRGRMADARAELDDVLAMLGIEALLARRPGALSGGERQRVAIGRALLSGPRLLVLDEPLAALDPARKAEILPFLERLRDRAALPILYVTHAMDEVARLARDVVVLEAGRVVSQGPASEVLSDPAALSGMATGDVGAVLEARLVAHAGDGLSELAFSGGALVLPRITARPGDSVRVRIAASDVLVSTRRPEGLSALNILQAEITRLQTGRGPGVLVQLRCGQDRLLARVTARSAEGLALAPGMQVFAVIKSLAVASGDVGTAQGSRPRSNPT